MTVADDTARAGPDAPRSPAPSDPVRVAVCVCTYRRPQGLFALLGALEGQVFTGPAPELRVVVVDNDAWGSARSVCEEAAVWLRHPLDYRLEKRRGIPIARNAAVSAAWDADWIAFVDDDEVPEPGWLDALLRTQREHAADVVTGPVPPRFESPPPRWLEAGPFFDWPSRSSGTRLPSARTGNALVRTACLARLDRLFDERMTPMGEDTELFRRLAAAGAAIVWADEAVVWETVPPERMRAGWLVRRSFRAGVAAGRILRRDLPSGRILSRVFAGGAWCVARGCGEALLAPWLGVARAVQGLRIAAFGAGRFIGFAGG